MNACAKSDVPENSIMLYLRSFPLTLSIIFLHIIVVKSSDFNLTVLHVNDIHARFLQTNQYSGRCSEGDEERKRCYGGLARIQQKVNEIRETHKNVAFLSAGDFFQGTMWYMVYKWRVVAHFVNKLRLTAMAIGNHELDDGVEGLIPFLEAASFPVVSSNIRTKFEPAIQGKFTRSAIIDYDGQKVGIIGYTSREAKHMSNGGKLTFRNEVEGVKKEAKKLHKQGIKILIALGHAGFDIDLKVAMVPYIDLVVGGHTNTFLYSGEVPPDVEVPVGKYPTIVEQSNGRKVPVVQAYAYGKYLGYLNLTFDENGEVTSWAGYPILLNSSIPEDAVMKNELNEWGKNISASTKAEVGKTRVLLDGRNIECQMHECNLGNVIADAMIHLHLNESGSKGWSDVTMAILNSGRIHGSIDESSSNGTVIMDDIFMIMPFQNTIDVIEIQGKYLREAFEFSVARYDPKGIHTSGRFLQVSGIRVLFDITREEGKRVIKMDRLCTKCRVPNYVPLNSTEIYKVVLPSSLADGGDGYDVIRTNVIDRQKSGILDTEMMFQYFRDRSPIIQGVDGRITFLNGDEPNCLPKNLGAFDIRSRIIASHPQHGPDRIHLGTIKIMNLVQAVKSSLAQVLHLNNSAALH